MKPSLEEVRDAFLRLLPPAESPAPPAENPPAAAAAPAASTAAPAAGSCQVTDFKKKGCHLDVALRAEQLVAAAQLLNAHGFAIDTVTGVDWIAAGEMEVIYDFFHPATALHVVLRTRAPRANPEVPTISRVFPGANWHERETHEFFGIQFAGHPNLTPLLLPEDSTDHPLRKDFAGAN